MNFYSLNKKAPEVSFKDAVIAGIAPDRGLYFPKEIVPLPTSLFDQIEQLSDHEIGFRVIQQFVGETIPENVLKEIIADVLDFNFPLIELEDNVASLELFHGPTFAFKDVGARFMARCLGHFSTDSKSDITVLVATSGDTGGAVASGFLEVSGVNVVILYPSGKISDIQEKQLTTLGKNITALEVNGTFDDCQDMVKTAFMDTDINKKIKLTSANSINVGRWLPQMFYYFLAYKQLKSKHKELVFSVPSGNFGNVCAGLLAKQLGLPVVHFVAATNNNAIVPNFMESGVYHPKPSVATISNAMDVGDPSNFIRIRHLFNDDLALLRENLSSYSFTDEQTKGAMRKIYNENTYVADPHGAVAYLGLKKYQESHPNTYGIFLETAHPVKFLDIVEDTIRENIELPEKIAKLMDKKKKSIKIADYIEFKNYLFMS